MSPCPPVSIKNNYPSVVLGLKWRVNMKGGLLISMQSMLISSCLVLHGHVYEVSVPHPSPQCIRNPRQKMIPCVFFTTKRDFVDQTCKTEVLHWNG